MSEALLLHLKGCFSKYQLYQCTEEDLRLLKRIIQEVTNYPKDFKSVGRLLDRKYSDEAVCRRFEKESQQLLNNPRMYAYEPAAHWWPRRGAARPYAHIFPRHRRSEFVEDTWEGKDGNTVYGLKWACPIDALHDKPNKKPLDIYKRLKLAISDLKSDPPDFQILLDSRKLYCARWVVILIYILVDTNDDKRPFFLSEFQKWGWYPPVKHTNDEQILTYNERTGRSFAFLTLLNPDPRPLLDLAKEAMEVIEEDRTSTSGNNEDETSLTPAVAEVISANGYVENPADPSVYFPVTHIIANHSSGLAGTMTPKRLSEIVEKYEYNHIRWTRPISSESGLPMLNRRSIHLIDWLQYVDRFNGGGMKTNNWPQQTPGQIEDRKAAIRAEKNS